MSSELIRAVINSLLPKGSAWSVKEGGDLDKLLDGISDNIGLVQEFLESLAYIRDPQKTPVLDDLERDYDVLKDALLTERERRDQLSAIYPKRTPGTAEYMQEKLRAAGFDVYVHRNNPPVNFTEGSYAVFGNTDAQFEPVTGDMQFGGWIAAAKLLVNAKPDDVEYEICPDACTGYLAGVFFIGGPAERNPVTHELINIDIAIIPAAQKDFFERIIMCNKPFHTWANLIVEFV